jgi:hypothetical protein
MNGRTYSSRAVCAWTRFAAWGECALPMPPVLLLLLMARWHRLNNSIVFWMQQQQQQEHQYVKLARPWQSIE